MKQNIDAEIFIREIKNYIFNNRHEELESPSFGSLMPSASDYADQKVIKRSTLHRNRAGTFRTLVKKIPDIARNLNYKASLEDWNNFYTYPSLQKAIKYAEEEEIDIEKVINLNEEGPVFFADEIIELAHLNDNTNFVKFLTGTTGVGKTTFLKFFCKTQKDKMLKNDIIISRVKYNDIDGHFISGNKKELFSIFTLQIINCLVRDVCDSYIRAKVKEIYPNQTKYKKLSKIIDSILLTVEEKENNLDDLIEEFNADQEIFQDIEIDTKIKLLKTASKEGFKFCIILDGFDAMKPEEIMLFNNTREADFFSCLTHILKNEFSNTDKLERCIAGLSKVFLVAVRPVTISQLQECINREADFHYEFNDDHAHIVGSDIYTLLENRIRIYFKDKDKPFNGKKELDKFCIGVNASIKYILSLMYDEHKALEKGRFINLFNHNIREKLRFLADSVDLLAFKVENKFESDKSKRLIGKDENLDVSKFLNYLEEDSNLGIELYEIQRLLILNKAGYFRNFFKIENTTKEIRAEVNRGQFDNIFNYIDKKFYNQKIDEKNILEKESYRSAKDPILERYLILYRLLSDEQKVPVTILRGWFNDNFKLAVCTDTSLRLLIRSGLIIGTYIADEVHLSVTAKGKFVYDELCGVNIYLEHVLLNCKVPYFLSKKFIIPKKNNNREWGRISITNVTVFLNHLRQVLMEMIKNEKIELKETLLNEFDDLIVPSALASFYGIINEGLENEINRDYATDLKIDLSRIGINIIL